MTTAQRDLEELFGVEGAAALERLLRSLVPGDGDLPDAITAGVQVYIATILREQSKGDVEAYIGFLTAVSQKSRQMYELPFSRLDDEQAFTVLKGWTSADKNFGIIREDCFEGYFGHPRWRATAGDSIWPAVRYDPIFPCCERPDVMEREMLCEPRERLAKHMRQPEDRLPEAVREQAHELTERFCTGEMGGSYKD